MRLPGQWPDLRLAGAALGCWLTAFAGLYLPARATLPFTLAAGILAALVGVLAMVLVRRTDPARSTVVRVGWLAASVLLGVVCGAASTAAQASVRDAEPLAGLARHRSVVAADLVITDDPRPVRGARGPSTYAVPAQLTALTDGSGQRVRLVARVLVLGADPSWRGLLPGQRVTVSARLATPRGGDLRAAVLSTGDPPVLVGAAPYTQRVAGGLRAGLQAACAPLPPDVAGLLPGLVVGDTSNLDPAVADAFRSTGMTHLLAVSGSNCAVVIMAVLLAARWCRAGPALAAALCGLGLVGFVILARPSPSVLRAAAMGGLTLVALAAGRPRAAVPALAAAVALLIVIDPELAADPGFALSVVATAGLLLLAPGWGDALRQRGMPGMLADALAVPGAAQVACAPIIAAISGTVSLTAIPANLLAVPVVAPATVLGIAAALLSPVWMPGAQLAAWLASWPARWLIWLARSGADVPAGVLPWPGGAGGGLLLAVLLLAGLFAGRVPPIRRLALVTAVAAVVGALPVRVLASGWPPKGWLVVACDVGQGDAVVLAAGVGQAVVVDAGPDPAAVDRCLRRLAVRRVALVVITHFHADHIGGLDGVLRGRQVGAIVTTQLRDPVAGRASVVAAAAAYRTPIQAVQTGVSYVVGSMRLVALGPERTLAGTRSDPNNNSVVLLATVRGHTVLLTGDAETEEQRALLSAFRGASTSTSLRAEILKVPHHGSSFQDPEFLAAVDPSVALVSVGQGNDYGHPNAAVLSHLTRSGARVLRTDLHGDVAVVVRGDRLAAVTRGHDAGQ